MLTSSMPVNGAFYWYTAALAPESYSRPLAFMVGWTTVLSGVTSVASFAYAVASPLALFISKLRPEWEPTNVQIMGISMAIVALWTVLANLRLERISWLVFINSRTTPIPSVSGINNSQDRSNDNTRPIHRLHRRHSSSQESQRLAFHQRTRRFWLVSKLLRLGTRRLCVPHFLIVRLGGKRVGASCLLR